jgi:hypothetical protein
MADAPSRPPWAAAQRRNSQPPQYGRRPPERQLSTLGKIAVAVSMGVLGYYLLDGHGHTCEACGHRWRHLGAFNFGEVPAHACTMCGTVQFWKDGFKHVFPDPAQRFAPGVPSNSILAGLQEIRDFARQAIPSIAPASPPQQPSGFPQPPSGFSQQPSSGFPPQSPPGFRR